MKILRSISTAFLCSLIFCLAALPAFAQVQKAITSTQCLPIDVSSSTAVIGIQVTGTWTGTLQPQGTIQGQAAFNVLVTPSTSQTTQSTITAGGAYFALVAGYSSFQICGATVSSGTANVFLNVSQAPAGSGAGAALPASFSSLTPGTNTNGAMVVGTGSSLSASGTGTINATNTNGAILTAGLLAEYRMTEGTGTTLTDSSGNGNTATFPGGANNPTWLTSTGGLSFSAASVQYVQLPAAVTAAKTILLVTNLNVLPATGTFPAFLATNAAPGLQLTASNFDGGGFASNDANTPKVFLWNGATGTAGIQYRATPLGTHTIVYLLDLTADSMYFDGVKQVPYVSGQSQGVQTTGNFQLGGGNAVGAGGARNTNACTCSIYYAAFYSTELTAAQALFDYGQIQQMMASRGVPSPARWDGPADSLVFDGDSTSLQFALLPNLAVNNGIVPHAEGATGYAVGGDAGFPLQNLIYNQAAVEFPYIPTQGRATLVFWGGTNDCSLGLTGATTWQNVLAATRNAQTAGMSPFVMSMMSRQSFDTCKNVLDTAMRQQWQKSSLGFIDVGGDANLGCDGCYLVAKYFPDQVHESIYAGANIVAPMMSRIINRYYGNTSWSTATTYTTSAAAATTVTAAAESANIATYTFGSNPFPKGAMVTFAGITPAGYNDTCQAQTSTATQITCTLSVTGLGVGTVFGTGITSQQVDADMYTILGGSATTPNFTLETCDGYTGQNIYLKNTNTASPWTVTPFGSETIDGAATLTMPTATASYQPAIALQSTLVSSAAAGCNWKTVWTSSPPIQPSCAAVGTAASPSVVSCGTAATGVFACDVAASAATCTINTTAVTAKSTITVQGTTSENSRLGVTCNTAPTVFPGILIATKTAGTGFTMNMPTVTVNPPCFEFSITN